VYFSNNKGKFARFRQFIKCDSFARNVNLYFLQKKLPTKLAASKAQAPAFKIHYSAELKKSLARCQTFLRNIAL